MNNLAKAIIAYIALSLPFLILLAYGIDYVLSDFEDYMEDRSPSTVIELSHDGDTINTYTALGHIDTSDGAVLFYTDSARMDKVILKGNVRIVKIKQ